MPELTTASKSIWYLFKKLIQWILSKVSKKLQEKYFPIDLKKIRIELDGIPKIYSVEEGSNINIGFRISNFSPYYDYGILSIECEIQIWRNIFITLTKNTFLDLKVDEIDKQYIFSSNLGVNEAKRAQKIFNGRECANCELKLNCSVVTPLGVKSYIHVISHQIQLINLNTQQPNKAH